VTAESVKRISQRLLLQLTTPGGEKLSVAGFANRMFSVMLWPVSPKVHTEILQARQMNKAPLPFE
jgi:hypothetical protein